MINQLNTKSYKLMGAGVVVLLLASVISGEGSIVKDAVQGAMMGAGAVIKKPADQHYSALKVKPIFLCTLVGMSSVLYRAHAF